MNHEEAVVGEVVGVVEGDVAGAVEVDVVGVSSPSNQVMETYLLLKEKYVAEMKLRDETEEKLIQARNNYIVCYSGAERNYLGASRAACKLAKVNTSLKKGMAIKFVEGFRSCMEQIKVLFPDLDPEKLAQAGVSKKVEEGKIVPLFLAKD